MDHYHRYFSKLTSSSSHKKMEAKLKFKLKSLIEHLKVMIEIEASILQTKYDLRHLDSDTLTLKQARIQFENLKVLFDNVPLKDFGRTIDCLQEVFEVIGMLFERITRLLKLKFK